jgi:hypothetical protein
MTITYGYAPAECDRCERPWTHRPDTKTTAVLTGSNYLCDEHYAEAIGAKKAKKNIGEWQLTHPPTSLQPGETQIHTDGLRVSSYTTDQDGLLYLSTTAAKVLREALLNKQRLEQSAGCWMGTLDFTEPAALPTQDDEPQPTISARTMALTTGDNGECEFKLGTFGWSDDGGNSWTGSPAVVDTDGLIGRMKLDGPYKPGREYRIVEALEVPGLIIKPTCAGCGVIAGIDCQRAGEYLFGRADVTETLPIKFNDDHQFSISVKVATEGRNFHKKKPKTVWFNSARCAELFLIEKGEFKKSSATIGNGERLLAYLGGGEVVKARKKRAPNRAYLGRLGALNQAAA